MTFDDALNDIRAQAAPEKAAGAKAYHKSSRVFYGTANPALDKLVRDWRKQLDMAGRVALARDLWDHGAHETCIAAAKLLDQKRIEDDGQTWQLITSWLPDFDGWAIADHACIAGQKRVMADDSRLDEIAQWTTSDHMWTKRAAMVITLLLARLKEPTMRARENRERVLGWAAAFTEDQDWFIQKSVAWWLRDLSKQDPARVQRFLAAHQEKMKGFARKEAAKYLPR